MFKAFCALFIFFLLNVSAAEAQIFEMDTLQYQGSPADYINFVILGDGYTIDEQDKFKKDAINFENYFFSQSPYSFYRNYFNVFLIKVPSPESGVKHPHTALDCPDSIPYADPHNYFGSSFDKSGIHRLVTLTGTAAVGKVLAENFPEYDQVIVLANSDNYGGSGGVFPVATVNQASNEIAVHELGHSFANLADEYWAGAGYAAENPNRTQETNPDSIKWKSWLGSNGIGIYNYGGKAPSSIWYRPAVYCKMQYLGFPFCSVCTEAIIEKIHSLVYPVRSFYPQQTDSLQGDSLRRFSARLIKPSPNTLRTEWFINDKPVARNKDSVIVEPDFFANDINTVKLTVMDTADMLRDSAHFKRHSYSIEWQVFRSEQSLQSPEVTWNPVEVCFGTSTTLSVSRPRSGGQYTWYTDSTSENVIGQDAYFVTPAITDDTSFFVALTMNEKTSMRTKVSVKVLPVPVVPQLEIMDTLPVSYGNVARLKVINNDRSLKYAWYGSASGRHLLAEDTLVVTPGLTSETSYYVESVIRRTGCASTQRTKITVPVQDKQKNIRKTSRRKNR